MGSNLFIYAAAAGISLPFIALLVLLVVRSMMSENARRRVVAMRQSRRLPLILAIVVPAVFLLTISIILAPFGGSMFVRVLKNLPMAGMFAGMQFLALSRRPVGDRIRCSRCKYDLYGLSLGPSSGPSGRHDGKCPECGGQWGWSGGSEKAVKVWSWKWTAAGVILLLPLITQFASAPIMGVLWWEGALLRVVPTSSLVEEVLTQRSFTMAAWTELAKRSVSAEDTDRIARKLLLRPVGAFFSSDEQTWLASALGARSIDPGLVEPRLRELFTVRAQALPDGSHLSVQIKPEPRAFDPFPTLQACVVVVPGKSGASVLVSPIVVSGRGIALYKVYHVGPFVSETTREGEERFRGTMTVALETSAMPRPRFVIEGHPTLAPGGLYRVDVPVDVPVEKGK